MSSSSPSRRDFLRHGAVGTAGLLLPGAASPAAAFPAPPVEPTPAATPAPAEVPDVGRAAEPLDLSPARWIWYPSERTLPNTFVLFRKELHLDERPRRARGWVIGESRYQLSVNGARVQWGPAPSDPRWTEVDPVDLTDALRAGPNVLGAQVLFFGHGDGTWPAGKPGFLFRLELELPDGSTRLVVSDESWRAHLARSWRPGQYKRWYLRALQEEFDARAFPGDWTRAGADPAGAWLPALVLDGPADKPAVCTRYGDYLHDTGVSDAAAAHLRRRSVPMVRESIVPVTRLAYSLWVDWKRPPEEYFEMRVPDAFVADRTPSARREADGSWTVLLDGRRAAALTFELDEQVVGWPRFTVDAPEGTVVELMVQEAHRPGGPALLNTQFHAWTRFTCRGGTNHFEPFEYESFRWLQLHVRNAEGPVRVRDVAVRRRQYPWPNAPRVECSDERVRRLAAAAVNTLHNAAQETIVDGMARERQQYSGDVGHAIHAIHQAFGDTRLPARFVTTFSQGMTLDGYFLDCWPAYDRLSRVAQRQLGLTRWGPILDHGVGFVFDCSHHYRYTGALDDLREPYPRLVRFFDYLRRLRAADGLLPVEDLGVPWVWMDNAEAYPQQRQKQCAFNLYVAAMAEHALAPLCRAFGHPDVEARARRFGRDLLAATKARFWSGRHALFVNNLPWLREDGAPRLCDRSLATSVLFDQCPGGSTAAAVRALAETPPEMGLSFPGNMGWRLWALAQAGRIDAVLHDLRTRWWAMDSVRANNTLQEHWQVAPDSTAQWSHIPVAPLYVLYMDVAGIRPTAPGYARFEVRPQLGDLELLDLTAFTVKGPIRVRATGRPGDRVVELSTPAGADGVLLLDPRESVPLPPARGAARPGLSAYRLPPGSRDVRVALRYT